MNAYVAAGYIAIALLLGGYAAYVRRRARVLARIVPPPEAPPAGTQP